MKKKKGPSAARASQSHGSSQISSTAPAQPSALLRINDPTLFPSPPAVKVLRAWPKGVRFKRNQDGSTSADVCNNTPTQVTVTYIGAASELHQVRTFVVAARKRGSLPTVPDVRSHLSGTHLVEIADDRDLAEWIEVFSDRHPPRAKGVALVFLEKKTGLERKTLKTYFSRDKKNKSTTFNSD